MSESKAANVILAKIHAMYGHRLFPSHYKNMITRTDIPQLAAYLKNETYFSEYLSTLTEQDLEYSILEREIYASIYTRIQRLLRYDFADNKEFYDYVILQGEMSAILSCLRGILASNHSPTKISQVPGYLLEKSTLDLNALQRATTFQELCMVLTGSHYLPLILNSCGDDPEHIKTESVESALMADYLHRIFSMIEHNFSGATSKELKDTFRTHADVTNVPLLFRLKRYFKYSKEEIQSNLIPFEGTISQKELDALMDLPMDNPKLLLEECVKALLGSKADTDGIVNVEQAAFRRSFTYYNKLLRYSIHPPCVYLAYVELMYIEAKNIINIIEGIRYRVTPQEIEELIIY